MAAGVSTSVAGRWGWVSTHAARSEEGLRVVRGALGRLPVSMYTTGASDLLFIFVIGREQNISGLDTPDL